jgi:hypothetical protein
MPRDRDGGCTVANVCVTRGPFAQKARSRNGARASICSGKVAKPARKRQFRNFSAFIALWHRLRSKEIRSRHGDDFSSPKGC